MADTKPPRKQSGPAPHGTGPPRGSWKQPSTEHEQLALVHSHAAPLEHHVYPQIVKLLFHTAPLDDIDLQITQLALDQAKRIDQPFYVTHGSPHVQDK